jgi:hypothetical protein
VPYGRIRRRQNLNPGIVTSLRSALTNAERNGEKLPDEKAIDNNSITPGESWLALVFMNVDTNERPTDSIHSSAV